MDRDAFVDELGGIFEQSPWVASATWDKRPFPDPQALWQSMCDVVLSAPRARQLSLLRAHPELGARTRLTRFSEREQKGACLYETNPEQEQQLRELNRSYREKFGFPFIVAVKGLDAERILAILQRRLDNDAERELAECLSQTCRIAVFRLAEVLGEPALPSGA